MKLKRASWFWWQTSYFFKFSFTKFSFLVVKKIWLFNHRLPYDLYLIGNTSSIFFRSICRSHQLKLQIKLNDKEMMNNSSLGLNISNGWSDRNIYTSFKLTYSEQIVLIAVLSMIILVSLYGNLGMLYVLQTNQKMWSSTYMLIGNLAVSGVLVTLVSTPFSIASVVKLKWPFNNDTVCYMSAFMNSVLLLVTIFTHTTISISKYFGVVKPYSRFMTITRTRRIIFTIWFLACLMSVGPIAKFGRYAYGPTTLACGVAFPKTKPEAIYLLILSSVGFIVPVLLMINVYIKIFLSMRKRTKRLLATSSSSMSPFKLQKKLLTTTLFSLLCFLLCWTPFCMFVLTALVVGSRDKLPRGLGISAYWSGFSYNALNPIIFIVMCPRFREGLFWEIGNGLWIEAREKRKKHGLWYRI